MKTNNNWNEELKVASKQQIKSLVANGKQTEYQSMEI